jgi:hypothetical protein
LETELPRNPDELNNRNSQSAVTLPQRGGFLFLCVKQSNFRLKNMDKSKGVLRIFVKVARAFEAALRFGGLRKNR